MRRWIWILFIGLTEVLSIAFLILLSGGKQWFYPSVLPRRLSLENWSRLFDGGSMLQEGLVTSLTIALAVAVSATLLGLPLSKALGQRKGGLLGSLAYWPFLLSPVILAVLLQRIFVWLGWSGMTVGVLAGHLYLALPYAVLLYRPFWNDRNLSLLSAAETLGAPSGFALRKVLLPLAAPFVALCFFQTFLISWFEFGLTQLIGVGKVKTLPVLVFNYINEANLFYAAVASLLIIIPPLLLLILNRRVIVKRV